MSKHGLLLLEGKVSAGFSDKARQTWMLWAEDNLLTEEGRTLWVDPFIDPRTAVITVEAVLPQTKDTLIYNKPLNNWVFTKNAKSGTLEGSKFVRIASIEQILTDDLSLLDLSNLGNKPHRFPSKSALRKWLLP